MVHFSRRRNCALRGMAGTGASEPNGLVPYRYAHPRGVSNHPTISFSGMVFGFSPNHMSSLTG